MRNAVGPTPGPVPGTVSLLGHPRFELVPVRGAEDELDSLRRGSTVAVTSSPRKGLEPTLQLCESLAEKGFRPVPHLAARLVESRAHLHEIAGRLRARGIREIFAVGGDSPEPAGPFASSHTMLVALAEMGHRFDQVGVAGYPERHPLIDEEQLRRSLLDKEPHASYLVTQICFDARTVVEWIRRLRHTGLSLPVHVGVPGAVSRTKLLEISVKIGVGDSLRYLRKQGRVVAQLAGRRGFRPGGFVTELAALLEPEPLGVAGLHINTFNQIRQSERWRREMLASAGSA